MQISQRTAGRPRVLKSPIVVLLVVALTGFTRQEDIEALMKGGCSHYLGKPFTQEMIRKTIRDIFKEMGQII